MKDQSVKVKCKACNKKYRAMISNVRDLSACPACNISPFIFDVLEGPGIFSGFWQKPNRHNVPPPAPPGYQLVPNNAPNYYPSQSNTTTSPYELSTQPLPVTPQRGRLPMGPRLGPKRQRGPIQQKKKSKVAVIVLWSVVLLAGVVLPWIVIANMKDQQKEKEQSKENQPPVIVQEQPGIFPEEIDEPTPKKPTPEKLDYSGVQQDLIAKFDQFYIARDALTAEALKLKIVLTERRDALTPQLTQWMKEYNDATSALSAAEKSLNDAKGKRVAAQASLDAERAKLFTPLVKVYDAYGALSPANEAIAKVEEAEATTKVAYIDADTELRALRDEIGKLEVELKEYEAKQKADTTELKEKLAMQDNVKELSERINAMKADQERRTVVLKTLKGDYDKASAAATDARKKAADAKRTFDDACLSAHSTDAKAKEYIDAMIAYEENLASQAEQAKVQEVEKAWRRCVGEYSDKVKALLGEPKRTGMTESRWETIPAHEKTVYEWVKVVEKLGPHEASNWVRVKKKVWVPAQRTEIPPHEIWAYPVNGGWRNVGINTKTNIADEFYRDALLDGEQWELGILIENPEVYFSSTSGDPYLKIQKLKMEMARNIKPKYDTIKAEVEKIVDQTKKDAEPKLREAQTQFDLANQGVIRAEDVYTKATEKTASAKQAGKALESVALDNKKQAAEVDALLQDGAGLMLDLALLQTTLPSEWSISTVKKIDKAVVQTSTQCQKLRTRFDSCFESPGESIEDNVISVRAALANVQKACDVITDTTQEALR